ncbi:MAG TPA: DUF3300 domain-containing protein, partial [Vicinamibacterales bacterium]|nr:DUF3300 domain-containing protein [Vicinamibacterales bacterium]
MTTRIIVGTLLLLSVACGGSPKPQGPTGTLENLVAPIALYPDALLAQMLISATDPDKVVDLDMWLKANKNLKGTQLQDEAVRAGFDASYIALVLFPDVVANMASQIAWTRLLGQSFMSDRMGVMAAIQSLRQKAQNVGNLKTTPQQQVQTKTMETGENVIVIEPANPQVVYVPQYKPEVVYVQAPPATTTTVVVEDDDDDAEAAVAGLIGFTAGIAIGASMNNSYYYGPMGFYGAPPMYYGGWNNYYEARDDARDDWMDHREDMFDERSDRLEDRQDSRNDRLENSQGQRSERTEQRQENRPQSQAERTERRSQAQSAASQRTGERSTQAQGAAAQRTGERSAQAQGAASQRTAERSATGRTGSAEARGYGGAQSQAASQRSTDAFSGYQSGGSQRASS